MTTARALCEQIWQEELGRPIDPEALTECLRRCINESPAAIRQSVHDSAEGQAYRTRPKGVTTRLVADGWSILDASTREAYLSCAATNFLLFQRYLEGQDIEPLLYPGFHEYRVTTVMHYVPQQAGFRDLRPETYDDLVYWKGLDNFLGWLADHGKRVELTVFCDTRVMDLSQAWMDHHFQRVCEIVRNHPNVLLELANEVGHPTQAIDPLLFERPRDLFACAGSSLSGGLCPLPAWEYSAAHLRRDAGKMFDDTNLYWMSQGWDGGYAGTHGPVKQNEIIGAADQDVPGRRSSDPDLFWRLACMSRAWSGMTFHSEAGVGSTPMSERQAQCAAAFVRGLNGQPMRA